ncbi:MAG: hypothetical protein ACI841_001516 [Planctomycetota bacterium]|jgi:hypothetical protein
MRRDALDATFAPLMDFDGNGIEDAIDIVLGVVADAKLPASGQIVAGATWNFQGWFRDPAGPCGFAFKLTNALSVTFTTQSSAPWQMIHG